MITCLNLFPYKNGISIDLIPVYIFQGYPNPYYNKLKTTFGAYAHLYIDTSTGTKQRMVGAIALRT